ncbi:histidine ammonia-lyase [Mycoplasmatota bacterium]|nr:histidine ammonia-lyase [Mycoplasmatota bacterium]
MIILDGHSLTIEKCKKILTGEKVRISEQAIEKVNTSRKAVEKIVDEDRVVYGITTGFGLFCNVLIDSDKTGELQINLIRSHAVGVGEPFNEEITKLMLVLRANALLKGHSGVRIEVIEQLLKFVNMDIYPVIPCKGSLGASGDLAPLSHLALSLIGEGFVKYNGVTYPTDELLQKLNITPIKLQAKEGLGLINGTQAMTAVGVLAYIHGEKLAYLSEYISSFTMQALESIIDVFDEEIHISRGYQEQIDVAKRFRNILNNSKLMTRQGELRVQDAYSIRCVPQVHGACFQALNYVKEKLEIEMNASTDNPLIFDDGNKVISAGNFHGEPIAFAMDFLKLPMCELANISERRIERLVNPALNNDFPGFLSNKEGLESGAMILQYSAASLVSENKTLAHPASVDSIPSSANQEDHVSMGTIAARHALEIIENSYNVLAIELFCSAQAVHLMDSNKLSPISQKFYDEYREKVQHFEKDRMFSIDINKTNEFMKSCDISG